MIEIHDVKYKSTDNSTWAFHLISKEVLSTHQLFRVLERTTIQKSIVDELDIQRRIIHRGLLSF